MNIENITRTRITPDDGMVLTNGTDYVLERILFKGENPANWYEITEAEYEEIQTAIDGQSAEEPTENA